jgi:cytochrome b subunit of formate dehydrogenase
MIGVIFAAIACFLALASGFHFYWAFGGKVGWSVAVPQKLDGTALIAPPAPVTFLVGAALAGIVALLALYLSGLELPTGRLPIRWLVAAIGLVFFSRGISWHPYVGLFKSIRSTAFGRNDTWFYSPACALCGLGFFYLAWLG